MNKKQRGERAMFQMDEPKEIEFYDKATGRMMLLVDDDRHSFSGWLCYKHPDGQWVTERKPTDEELQIIKSLVSEAYKHPNCTTQSPEDKTCQHPDNNGTPECNKFICPHSLPARTWGKVINASRK